MDTPAPLAVRFVMFFVCLAALFMTSSRGGVLVSLLAFVVAVILFFRRDLPRGKSVFVALVVVGAIALLLLQLLGGNVGYRIDMEGLADAGRISAYRSTLQIIAANPWFGTGLGTFPWAFPPYRSGDISMVGVWDRAHSTPLELAAEVGIPLAVVTALAWLAGLLVLFRALRGSRRHSGPALVALAIALIALIHSAIDFSLQVSGYAITAFGMIGVGLAQSFNPMRRNPRVGPDRGETTVAPQESKSQT
jgi:O-antigen ligase